MDASHLRALTMLCGAVAMSAAGVARAVTYNVLNLGTLGGTSSSALDVNNNRRVSGTSGIAALEAGATGSTFRAYSYAGGSMTNVGALPGATTNRYARGYAVNDFGVVVGEFNNDASRAFAYNPSTSAMIGLTRLSGGTNNGVALDVNNANVIVGVSSNGIASRATRWTYVGGRFVPGDLGSADGLTTTAARANAVNQNGIAAGLSRVTGLATSQATLFANGTAISIGSLGDGARFSAANGLNDGNVVVGYGYTGRTVGDVKGTTSTTDVQRAFSWKSGAITQLDPVNVFSASNPNGTLHSVANDVNNAGTVVGNSQVIQGLPSIATIWIDGVAIDLNTWIAPDSGWNLTSAEGINDAGDITGNGTFNGASRAFLITIPEPASLGSLSAVAVAIRRRRWA